MSISEERERENFALADAESFRVLCVEMADQFTF